MAWGGGGGGEATRQALANCMQPQTLVSILNCASENVVFAHNVNKLAGLSI